ncbi:MAG: alpha-L-fucosidase [Bacteroidales bacterium]|nr:alpha-L-fucosidase [Bacteroidales bacterium]
MKYPKILSTAGLIFIFYFGISGILFSQETSKDRFGVPDRPIYVGNNQVEISLGEAQKQIIEKAARVTPSSNQLNWQQSEFNAFIHFGPNTFMDKEWGDGKADPAIFNPSKLNARQWVRAFQLAGMKMVVLTVKHHDGFCLWPTRFTAYNISATPWRKGKGDLVREVSDACKSYGMKFGIYVSPWDRHESSYGDSQKYNEFFRNLLKELLSGYGDISEVWFDGACGEGPNGKKQVYDWSSYYQLVRELQPGAVIAIMGPDVRWVGNEAGYGREEEWSVIPMDEEGFVPRDLMEVDLGSDKELQHAKVLRWYPAETDVSIRPGWFYHAKEDSLVKTADKLVDIYFNSVGRNSVLLLNVPPNQKGLIHKNDVKSLSGMRKKLSQIFSDNILTKATVGGNYPVFEYNFPKPVKFNVALIQEDIKVGQRIEKFHFEIWDGQYWKPLVAGTTVGYKRLFRFPEVTVQRVRLVIDQARDLPSILKIGLYSAP